MCVHVDIDELNFNARHYSESFKNIYSLKLLQQHYEVDDDDCYYYHYHYNIKDKSLRHTRRKFHKATKIVKDRAGL